MKRKTYGIYRFPEEPKLPLCKFLALGLLLGVAIGTTIAVVVFSL